MNDLSPPVPGSQPASASHMAARPGPVPVFTQGSILRHVLVMTGTGSLGLVAVFVVDLLSLIYVSWLGQPALTAGVGYATQVLFLLISMNIGFVIAITALVSRNLGAGHRVLARTMASNGLLHGAWISVVVSAIFWIFRDDLLRLFGAHDASLVVANRFLAIVLPSNVLMTVGMSLSGVLRAQGDARRAMYVTLFGGLVTAALDPLLIFGFKLGVDGAALSTVAARIIFTIVGFWGAGYVHGLLRWPSRSGLRISFLPLMAIAGPAILTNLAAPIANGYALRVLSAFGETAIAAATIIDRVSPVAFGVLFAMSGSVGPIMGQNVGARLPQRVRDTLSTCFGLTIAYTVVVWVVLWLAAPQVAALFNAEGRTREIVIFFCHFGASAWLFLGCLFVANAAFNNLGFPILSTVFNWGRATLGTIPFVTLGASWYGPEGGYVGIIFGAAVFGIASVITAYGVTGRLAQRMVSDTNGPSAAPASG